MYKQNEFIKTSIICNNSVQGETIEQKVRRFTTNKEPIKDGAPLMYTDRKDGVKPEYNIRTDKWEIAVDKMSAVAQTQQSMRGFNKLTEEEKLEAMKNYNKEKETGGQPTDTTNNK